MIRGEESQRSILIVSAVDAFSNVVKKMLRGFLTIDVIKSATAARRRILERSYDLIVVNAPLTDEPGEDFVRDVVDSVNSSVLVVVPREVLSEVSERFVDKGVLVIAKPFRHGQMDWAIRFLVAKQDGVRRLEKKILSIEEKLEEQRLVSRAKLILVDQKHMSEEEAHRFIIKGAMDGCISRRRMAQKVIDDDL